MGGGKQTEYHDWAWQGKKEVVRAGSEFRHTQIWTLFGTPNGCGILFNLFKPWLLCLHTGSDNTTHFMRLLGNEIRHVDTKTCSTEMAPSNTRSRTTLSDSEGERKIKDGPEVLGLGI